MTPSPSQLRAGGVWVTISNWALACQRRWGTARIITPGGVLNPREARLVASRRGLASPRRSLSVPGSLSTAVKDVKASFGGRGFARWIRHLPLPAVPVPFVWQHHDLFQKGGVVLARRLGRPLVLFVDAMQVWEARTWGVKRRGWGSIVQRFGELPQLREADVIACVSEEVANVVLAHGIPPDRVLVTPCTADGTMFHQGVSATGVRQRYGLNGSFVVGWVGSFRPFHAVDELIEAFALARQEIPEARLMLVGDGQERESMRLLAERRGLHDVILTGAVPFEDVPKFIAAMDIAVVSAKPGREFHYSPLKLKEYLAAGKPVVAPNIGEMARTLTSGTDSILYRSGEVEDLARAIRTLSLQPRLREKVARGARARYEAEPDSDSQVAKVVESLQRAGWSVR